ncbi:hypothetical protein TS85_11825 [Sphingomonas hengshuiensis]|uniref:DUF4153 domain-containing protein n=1 Tax=Sphingomonas hengshuiensis TaxID=1609977 RepID=A0A7U5CV58_9SPHN|nr:hypothetical protein TS85_11825 [Sphingomonas hengshuiensis]
MEEPAKPWPLRPVLLAVIGLGAGLLAHLILGKAYATLSARDASLLTGVLLGAVLTGFTLERRLWWASIVFALVMAVVGALVLYWNGSPGGWSAGEGWRMVSLALAVAIAAPLFQAARDEGTVRTPYPVVHDHAWTNIVLWCACWLFVAIVFAMTWLLASLFLLIKIEFLRELLEKNWFWRALIGAAFGAGLGVLRENDGVVRLLQRVVATVLGVLAPVLAVGLVLFLLALPFTGLNALWDATSATTPILLSCAIGALILANAVIGNAPEQEKRFPLLRFGAMALAATILPLAVLATIAIALRTGQYGFTPQRLWAIVFVAIACLYGAAYWVALAWGRLNWGARVRPLNLALAFLVCGVALVLATPLVSFNAISTRDQVARLEAGKLTPETFDWRALAYDFGEPGRAALAKLRGSANAEIRRRAMQATEAPNRWGVAESMPPRADLAKRIRVLPAGSPPIPDALLDYLAQARCGVAQEWGCTVVLLGADSALLLRDSCFGSRFGRLCDDTDSLRQADGKWNLEASRELRISVAPDDAAKARVAAQKQAYAAGQIEVRKVERRQVFVGGQPVGDAFE